MEEYLRFAQDLADQAGKIMLEHFQVGVASQPKAHLDNTPVTLADTLINRLVIDAVRAKYPTHAVIGEEESSPTEGAEFTWVCDPVDGTIPYTMGIPVNLFSLALVNSAGAPVVAVVYDPYLKRQYTAVKGQGAFMNGAPIHVNGVSDLAESFVGASGRHSKTVEPLEFRRELLGRCYRMFLFHCSIYESMLVALGQTAASVYTSSHAHDVAAAALIVTEAGGRATDMLGGQQRYDQPVRGAILSNGAVHEALTEMGERHKL